MAWNQVKQDFFKLLRDSFALVAGSPAIRRWRERHPKLVAFMRRRLTPAEFHGLPLTLLTAAFLFAVALFLGIAQDYLAHDPLIAADIRIANLLFALRSDSLLRVAYFVTLFAEAGIVMTAALGLTALLWYRGKRVHVLTLWLALATANGAAFIGKMVIRRPRPDALIQAISENSFSFPSQHATTAAAFYGVIAYIIIRSYKSWKARLTMVLSLALIVILVDLSRLYLGVHYLSDVLAGNLLGFAGLFLAIAVTEWLITRGPILRPKRFTLVELAATLLFLLAVLSLFYFGLAPLVPQHRPPGPSKPIATASVQRLFQDGTLPRYSETLTGTRQEPISLVIVSPDKCFEQWIVAAGWSLAETLSKTSAERLVKAALLNQEYPTAPITPSFYDTYPNDYGFERETDRKTVRSRHHARFWKPGYVTPDGELYVGTASLDPGLKWGITHTIAPDIDTERDTFVSDVQRAGAIAQMLRVPFVPPTLGRNFALDPFFTNGDAVFLTFKSCP